MTRSLRGYLGNVPTRRRYLIGLGVALVVVAAVGAMAGQRFARAKSLKNDLESMQGEWVTMVGEEQILMTVHGNEIELKAVPRVSMFMKLLAKLQGASLQEGSERGTFQIDPSRSPKTIDFSGGKGVVRPGIYEFDGPTLKLCLGTGKTVAPRPDSFDVSTETYSLFDFHRASP